MVSEAGFLDLRSGHDQVRHQLDFGQQFVTCKGAVEGVGHRRLRQCWHSQALYVPPRRTGAVCLGTRPIQARVVHVVGGMSGAAFC